MVGCFSLLVGLRTRIARCIGIPKKGDLKKGSSATRRVGFMDRHNLLFYLSLVWLAVVMGGLIFVMFA